MALLLASACDESPDDMVDSSGEMGIEQVEGLLRMEWEVSRLEPCGTRESWWVKEGDGAAAVSEEYFEVVGYGQPAFVRLRGVKSELGQWGRLGEYDREFEVTQVLEVRTARWSERLLDTRF